MGHCSSEGARDDDDDARAQVFKYRRQNTTATMSDGNNTHPTYTMLVSMMQWMRP